MVHANKMRSADVDSKVTEQPLAELSTLDLEPFGEENKKGG